MKYKWIVIALGISVGAVWSSALGLKFGNWIPWACGWGMAGLLAIQGPKRLLSFLFLLALVYGLSAIALDQDRFTFVSWRAPGKMIVMAGEVKTFPEPIGLRWKWEMQCREFRMEEGSWGKTGGQVEVSIPAGELPPLIGDELIVKGTIRFPSIEKPGGTWTQRRLFLKNSQAEIRVKKWGDVVFVGWNPIQLPLRSLQLLREKGAAQLDVRYEAGKAAILKALLLGARMPDPALKKIFSKTGTTHLLSVSGFHTAVIAGIIFSGLIIFRLTPQTAVIGATLGTLVYMSLTGWGVAVQRAGMMAILVWTAWIIGRPQPLIYWLNFALAGILWSDPKKIWDISFQLSFLSMYGILLIAPYFKASFKIPGLDVSLAAFLATYPVVLFYFQSFSWAGIFANLIAVPAFALILPLGFFSLIPGIGFIAVALVQVLLSGTLFFLEKIAGWPWACPTFQQPRLEFVLAYYFLGGALLWLIRQKNALRLASSF